MMRQETREGCTVTTIDTAYAHIELRDGVPFIKGTRTKVALVVRDFLAGLSAAEIHATYDDLSLGQIHGALAYYFDHADAIDHDLARRERIAREAPAWFPARRAGPRRPGPNPSG
jgi:uncharacterized protein (DUF433 family)